MYCLKYSNDQSNTISSVEQTILMENYKRNVQPKQGCLKKNDLNKQKNKIKKFKC